jgi:NAD(P)H dehydrogenase (quinone)
MNKVLIVYAHPGGKGHNAHILDELLARLKEQKQAYTIVDLYKEKFDPVLSMKEMSVRADKKVLTKHQELIAASDKIIFIYPIWWGTMPAVMKGFFDKNLSSGFAFRYTKLPFPLFGLKARPIGLLQGKKAVVFMTTGGPVWVNKLLLGNRHEKLIKKSVLGFCGIQSKALTLGNCGSSFDDTKKLKIKKMVKKGLSFLF